MVREAPDGVLAPGPALSVGTGRRQVLGVVGRGEAGAARCWVDVEEVGGTRGLKARVPHSEDRSTRV